MMLVTMHLIGPDFDLVKTIGIACSIWSNVIEHSASLVVLLLDDDVNAFVFK